MRSKTSIKMLFFIALATSLLMTACTIKLQDQPVATPTSIFIPEREDYHFEHENLSFVFSRDCDEEQAESCMNKVMSFFAAFGMPDQELKFFFGLEDNEASLCVPNTVLTLDDFMAIYALSFGTSGDPGMVYGAVAAVCEAEALCAVNRAHTDAELAAFYAKEEQLYLLDLTLPLLEDRFVDAETASLARDTALSLGHYVLDTQGRDELRALVAPDVAADRLADLKNAWLDAVGADADYTPFAPLRFARSPYFELPPLYSGIHIYWEEGQKNEIYPYVLRGDAVDWYFAADDVCQEGYVSFLSAFQHLQTLAELDFADARAILQRHLTLPDSRVGIYTSFHVENPHEEKYLSYGFEIGGCYVHEETAIYLVNGWNTAMESLLHEYVHYLKSDDSRSSTGSPFFIEALTEEVAAYECMNRMRRAAHPQYEQESTDVFRKMGCWDEEHQCLNYRNAYMLTSAMRYLGLDDQPYGTITQVFVTHPKKMTIDALSYAEGACLAWYMISVYGEDAVWEHAQNSDLYGLMGKTLDEFYNEFGEWVVAQREVYGWTLPEE